MAFTPRLTAPDTSNSKYYVDNPFYQSGYGMPNCTCYAYGRFWEISGTKPTLSLGDAGGWYGYDDGYKRGKTPKLGAVIVWESTVGGAGHVAVVERINSDGSFLISQSAWGGTLFWTETIPPSCNRGSSYRFLGFIYNPAVGVNIPTTWIKGNRYLNEEEMQNNALIIYDDLLRKGWSINAIAGLLGNMESESTINPAIWQNLTVDSSNGYGLVQWTPSTNYTSWALSHGYSIDDGFKQLVHIDGYTVSTGQWIRTDEYDISFSNFKKSTQSPEYLASAFLKNYERAGVEVEEERRTQARKWYVYLKEFGVEFDPVQPPSIHTKKNKRYNFVLFNANRRSYLRGIRRC